MIHVFFLLATAVSAAPVEGGVQVVVFSEGADFASKFIEGQEFDIALNEMDSAYGCYDRVGVRNFNLNIPVQTLSIELMDQEVSVTVAFDTIRGENMVLFGEDEDWFDVCASFTTDFHFVQVDDLVIKLALLPSVEDGSLVMELARDADISGSLTTDIDNVPDTLILNLTEDLIWEKIEETATEMIPELVASYWDKDMISGTVFDFDLSAQLDDAQVSTQALEMGATLQARWTGISQCDESNNQASGHGRRPNMDFGDGNGADFGLGITEAQLNQIFRQAWSDGFLCFSENRMSLVYDLVRNLIDPDIGGLTPSAIFTEPPVISIENGQATAAFPGLKLEILGEVNGAEVEIIGMEVALEAKLEIGLEPALSALTLTLHDLALDFDDFRADHILSDSEDAAEHMQDFLRGWVADWVSDQVQSVALFATQFHFLDTTIRLDDISYDQGGMRLLIKLYDEDDPEVDRIAPDTTVELVTTNPEAGQAILKLAGTDDRTGPLAYSVQIDGEGWSTWQLEDTFMFEDGTPSEHLVEVIARDNWLNVDDTPASLVVNLNDQSEQAEDKSGSCGCSGRPSGGGGFVGLLLVLATLAQRRR